MKLKAKIKLWLETENGFIFGEGLFMLLKKIKELGTMQGASEELGMSYRHAWGKIKNLEKKIGKPILKTYKGGVQGGGGAKLTEDAEQLMNKYIEIKKNILKISDHVIDVIVNDEKSSHENLG